MIPARRGKQRTGVGRIRAGADDNKILKAIKNLNIRDSWVGMAIGDTAQRRS